MARIKLVYVGGGSTRAAGTMASFMHNGADFDGSEVVLVDLDPDRLAPDPQADGADGGGPRARPPISATTDRRAGAARLRRGAVVSFRPGGFQASALDERIPLDMGVFGQETQGPGGFFMALRAIAVLRELCADMEEICPDAWIFNYTNPVNIVAEAVDASHSSLKIVSLCEGPISSSTRSRASPSSSDRARGDDGRPEPRLLERRATIRRPGCDPAIQRRLGAQARRPAARAAAPGCCTWRRPWDRSRRSTSSTTTSRRGARRAGGQADHPRRRTSWRAPDYWQHYEEQAETDDPRSTPPGRAAASTSWSWRST